MKTLEYKLGKATIRIMPVGTSFRGTVIRDGKMGPVLEDDDQGRLLARLKQEAGKLHPDYFGYDGAISRFRSFFPEGFRDPRFVEMERNYKLAARDRLNAGAPLESVQAGETFDLAAVAKAFQTNMLSVYEMARVSELLRGGNGVNFVRGAALFAGGDIDEGLRAMSKAIEPHGRASWPMVTYLPFLWDVDGHMYLKPEKTVDFAGRVGHPFAEEYRSDLAPEVYSALLELAEETTAAVRDLGPADRIDVQSFIWVVGDYSEDELPESS